MSDELIDLPFYHGALPVEDAGKALEREGDFLIVVKPADNKLILCVKRSKLLQQHELQRGNGTSVTVMNETFSNIRRAIETLQDKGEIKRPIQKSKWSITHSNVRIRRKIGSGAYGTVYQGYLIDRRNRPNSQRVAIKRLESESQSEQALIDMMKEARVMQMFKHPNIVSFFGFVLDRAPYLLVMELCKDGSVEDKLRNQGKEITVASRIDMSCQASRGMEYLHNKNCIHRDIATRNCLLHGSILKLADFGMCRPTNAYKVNLSKPQNVRWLAPEVWNNAETKFSTDVYAFGIMLWEMFEEPYTSPYSNWKALMVKERVMNGYRLPTSQLMPDNMAVIMKRCWNHDANKRPKAGVLRDQLEVVNKEYNPTLYSQDTDENTKSININTARTRSMMSTVQSITRNSYMG